jgi:hypothetical protein
MRETVMRRFFGPGLALFFLAPAIGELTCGNTPPRMFFNPLAIVLLGVLYGGGAILVRETTRRWNKGWLTLLALGAAYAWVEEGLAVKTYFNPEGAPGYLGSYGRWLDVNWVWSLDLTFYHAIYSIAVPILLVELMFPSRRTERWAGRWTQVILGALLIIEVLLGYIYFGAEGVANTPPYRPALGPYLGAVVLVVALVVLARYLPAGRTPRTEPLGPDAALPAPTLPRAPRPVWLWLTGFLGTILFMFDMWALPHLGLLPWATFLITAACAVVVGWLLVRMWRGGAAWTDRHRLALVAGPLTFFMLFTVLLELKRDHPKDTRGMALVGLAILVMLVVLWLSARRRRVVEPVAGAAG